MAVHVLTLQAISNRIPANEKAFWQQIRAQNSDLLNWLIQNAIKS